MKIIGYIGCLIIGFLVGYVSFMILSIHAYEFITGGLLAVLFVVGILSATISQWIMVGSLENGEYEKITPRRRNFVYLTGTLAGIIAGLSYISVFFGDVYTLEAAVKFTVGMLLSMTISGAAGSIVVNAYIRRLVSNLDKEVK